ncbi:prephenate dehydrogenase [Bacillus sp. FJAT-45066]|uniref:prephenate dehydrogenase n=1 Tax=Bacillus sp. FJAT-45066 TaxID=2011010 RepID=UPI000BB951C4|nr:prephenate dehydrogenase [Bacillus sp. FJAT-45066]
MKNVLLIGLGLIGGSVALAIKNKNPELNIIGFDIDKQTMNVAQALKVIDEQAICYMSAAKKCDLVIIAVPVEKTIEVMENLSKVKYKKPITITDVGSTKKKIVEYANAKFSNEFLTFIGGHPMAGSHKSGVTAAKTLLFENAYYILTPTNHTQPEKVEQLKEALSGTRAKFVIMEADEHDTVAGVISHFPHIIAASLVHQAEHYEQSFPYVNRLAAGGFRDITRIASSSPTMWKDILLQNKETLLSIMDNWIHHMANVKDSIQKGDETSLYTFFEVAKKYRDGLPLKEKGAIPSYYDLFIDVPDSPGVISEITGHLADERISITNIRIIETRTEVYGVLTISFQTEEDREKAADCIKNKTTYDTYIL